MTKKKMREMNRSSRSRYGGEREIVLL